MSWHHQNALKRVFNVFKRSKERKLPIYDNDIEALKLLSTVIENKSETYVNDNLLFGKLVLYFLNDNLHQTGQIKDSIKNLSNILKEPLNDRIEILRMNLNNQDLNNYLESIGINTDFYKVGLNDKKILAEKNKEMSEKIKKNWTIENVRKSFYSTANDLLKDIDNYN